MIDKESAINHLSQVSGLIFRNTLGNNYRCAENHMTINVRTANDTNIPKNSYWFDIAPKMMTVQGVMAFVYFCGINEHFYVFDSDFVKTWMNDCTVGKSKGDPVFNISIDEHLLYCSGKKHRIVDISDYHRNISILNKSRGQGIRIDKRNSVPNLISSDPKYQSVPELRVKLAEKIIPDDEHIHLEGSVTTIKVNRYERDRNARSQCIKHYGCICQACGIKLSTIYGLVAENFIHVHHIKKISSTEGEYHLDSIRDLRPLCPNCHAIAHLRKNPYTMEEIQEMIMKNKTDG